jgi:hypothetical protein
MLIARIFSGVAVASVLAASAVTLAAPAQAATKCDAGEFCVYTGANGTGGHASFKKGTADLAQQHITTVRSVTNNTGTTVFLYTGKNSKNLPNATGLAIENGVQGLNLKDRNFTARVQSVKVGIRPAPPETKPCTPARCN